MSWLVEMLLLRKAYIRETHSLDSDDFNNLMSVEKEVVRMISTGTISKRDQMILDAVISGKPFHILEKEINLSRVTISKVFKNVCDKIGRNLGGEFTDKGYIEYLADQYRLTDAQVRKLQKHIKSRFRHKVTRRQLQNE